MAAENKPVTYAEVHGMVGREDWSVLERFRKAGGQRDRWSKADKILMMREITRLEDRLELDCPSHPSRIPLRTLRRRIEDEVDL